MKSLSKKEHKDMLAWIKKKFSPQNIQPVKEAMCSLFKENPGVLNFKLGWQAYYDYAAEEGFVATALEKIKEGKALKERRKLERKHKELEKTLPHSNPKQIGFHMDKKERVEMITPPTMEIISIKGGLSERPSESSIRE